jgi:hypothetical protein
MKTVYIILAFCAGLFLGNIFFNNNSLNIKPPDTSEIKQEVKKTEGIDSTFSVEYKCLQNKNDSLSKQLSKNKILLLATKNSLLHERNNIGHFTVKLVKDSLCRDSVLVDSLVNQISVLNFTTDSIIGDYETKSKLMESMVAIKDSQIVVCNNAYLELRGIAQEQLSREQKLTEDLNTALKQQKQKRLQNRLLSAGMLFISGIAATLYIKSKP